MSARIGTCIKCGKTDEGIYTIEVCRGWADDKYNFYVEICQNCIVDLANWLNIPPGIDVVDDIGIFLRKQSARVVEIGATANINKVVVKEIKKGDKNG
jgi:hypothetical protein